MYLGKMNTNNTVAIISNSEYAVDEIKNMLILLRDVDKIECSDFFNAQDRIEASRPSVVIVHSSGEDENEIKLIKKIRESSDVPIILYPEFPSADFITEAFDAGISDILSAPIKDYELVIRVIWAIQKSEAKNIDKIKNKFFAKLGITDEETGFCKEEFSIKFLEAIIEDSKENNQNSCLILIKTKPAIDIKEDRKIFIDALKSSVRFNDIICTKDSESYYVFLSKSKLNGAYSVFERISSRLNQMTVICASVAEINDELFGDIINVLDFTMNKSFKNGEINVVKKQDYLDLYNEQDDRLEISKIFQNEDIDQLIPEDESSFNLQEDNIEEKHMDEDEKVTLGLEIMRQKIEDSKKELIKQAKETSTLQEDEIDKRNIVVYKQTWAKKLNIVVEPLIKKYAAKFQELYPTMDANVNISPITSYLKLDKDDIVLELDITYNGVKTIKFDAIIKALGAEIDSDSFDFEVMDFDYQKFEIVIKTITDEYKNYLNVK